MDEDGGYLSDNELSSLSKTMEPHLRVYHLRRRHPGLIIPPDASPIPDNPTLFCTYVKPGFVHVLAFSLANEENAEVAYQIVDTLPVALSCESDEDLLNRMRIIMALFTLQRQVVKICEAWSVICWPADITEDEHEAIMEVTGICTPTWSADLPPRDSEVWDYAFDLDFGSEDDTEYIKQSVKASRVRVKRWLAKVEGSDDIRESPLQ
ncbi:hypothetical protein EIP86_007593 [Pleurotus ostreatoroseus]|nr:hypothetical protein EIP86_007593 [Pleurotus ostreatoroseus]